MDSSTLGLIELILVFGLVVGWGLRELWLLKRDKAQRERETNQTNDRQPTDASGT